jgi:hypothetical protein
MLYAGNNLDKARRIFERSHKQRPRMRLTIRQRMRVLDESKRSFDAQTILPWDAFEIRPARSTTQGAPTAPAVTQPATKQA